MRSEDTEANAKRKNPREANRQKPPVSFLPAQVLGTAGDYYVAEGTLSAAEPSVPIPGSPDDDVEPRGQGA